jgi:hypothetical protein
MALSVEQETLIEILVRLRDLEKPRLEDATLLQALVGAFCSSSAENKAKFEANYESLLATRPQPPSEALIGALIRRVQRLGEG